MKIAFLSDAHGNPEGLGICLSVIQRFEVDDIYYLGDSLGYLTGEASVLDLLEEHGVICQRGNLEAMLLGDLPLPPEKEFLLGVAKVMGRITPDHLDFIRSWPKERELVAGERRILLSHGSPRPSLTEHVYADTPLSFEDGYPFDAVFLGHTHRPFIREVNGVLVVNVGSCGMPRDRGDMASFVVYDSIDHVARVCRTRFDSDKVIKDFWDGSAEVVRDVLLRRKDDCFGDFIDEWIEP